MASELAFDDFNLVIQTLHEAPNCEPKSFVFSDLHKAKIQVFRFPVLRKVKSKNLRGKEALTLQFIA